MSDYSVQQALGDNTLQYPTATVIEAAVAVFEEIVNATLNETGNGSVYTTTPRPRSPDELSMSIKLLFLFIAVLIIILGVAGNAFVVAVIFTDRKLLHSSVNLFLLNLALADMGNLIFCAPDLLMTTFSSPWVLPAVMCPVVRFLQQYFLFASVLLQMSIGIERFMAICSPLQMQRFSRRTTVFFLLLAWTFAALIAAPMGIYQRASYFKMDVGISLLCYPQDYPAKLKAVVEMVWFAILYCIPLVLLTVLYTIMCRRLWGKECMIAGETQQMAILRLRRSVVKMLVISMIIYYICYTPIQSLGFLHFKPRHWLRLTMLLLVVVSSAANPVVYIMCCRHFHQRFVSIVTRTIHCCARTPEKYQTVIADADKYARMSVVTHSSSSRRHRKVKQRERKRERSTDVSLSVRLLPQIDSPREVDVSLGDAAVVRCPVSGRSRAAYARVAVASDSPPSPALSQLQQQPRASTASTASFHWSSNNNNNNNNNNRFRHFRCTNPKKSTEMITVD